MMEKRVLEALDLFCNQSPGDHEQCAKMVNEYDLGDDNGKIQIDTKIRSKVRQRLQEGTKDQYEKKKVETIERFDAKHRHWESPKTTKMKFALFWNLFVFMHPKMEMLNY